MTRRPQRFIAIVLLFSPWIMIPTPFKDVLFIILGISLFFSTLDIRKKRTERALPQDNPPTPSTFPLPHETQRHVA